MGILPLLFLFLLVLTSASSLNIGINEFEGNLFVENSYNISLNASGTFLPLSGGILSGELQCQNIKPAAASTYSLGQSADRFFFAWLDNLNVALSANVTNLVVSGNFSAKRPYYTGYDNSTQAFINTANAQIMNLSNNNDYDAYLISIVNQQNITFKQTGDYLISVSPEFYQSSGVNKIITFWIQKNGADVPWSNSRYTMSNGEYNAPAILYQVDITNPSTDYVRIMWYSDSTASQIISISGLTLPNRPSIPGVLISIQKVSEITP